MSNDNEACFEGNKWVDTSTVEMAYLVKYMGPKKGSKPPWAIRHCAVYQNIRFDTRQASYILVRSSDGMKQRLTEITDGADGALEFAGDWTQIHSLCFGSVEDGTREYINYLDEATSDVVRSPAPIQTDARLALTHTPIVRPAHHDGRRPR